MGAACLFGTYARQHSANRLLRAQLEAAGYGVVECHVPLWERTRDKLPGFFAPLSLGRKGLEYVRALPKLVARWRAVGRDVDLVVAGFNGQLDLLVARRLTRGRIPILFAPLVTVTETLVDDRRVYRPGGLGARLAQWLDRATLTAADLVVTDTEAHRAYICESFGVDPARVQTVYLGAEPIFFTTSLAAAGPARSVLFYGQYVALHGASVIVDAVRRLQGRLEVTLVGTGPERAAVEAQARGVANLRFVDWVPYDDLPSWIERSDVCLGVFGTSRKAAMVIPNKVYQCAAGARPVVSADTTGVREVFADGETICLTAPGDDRQLADTLLMLAGDGDRRRALGSAARALMRERFDLRRQGERLRSLITRRVA